MTGLARYLAPHEPTGESHDPEAAVELLRSRRFVALTGAGMSTDSGIPDYRGPASAARNGRAPMTYQELVSGPAAQQRYWARAYVGWALMRDALPNAGHHALARFEAGGRCAGVITQNVDGLHEQAGTADVVALHGRISDVVCLSCGDRTSRAVLQCEMAAANPGWLESHRESLSEVHARPDGDADVDDTHRFVVPTCDRCGGSLKPDVVFFGENVPVDRVRRCHDLLDRSEALLVLGSSLTVMSGFRFVRHAVSLGLPVVVVNRGATRGDAHATYKVDGGTTEFLTHPAWLKPAASRP
ncbi:NAD-dependent protein deacetylase [Nocardioides marmoribigeumensis]|uniref:protein acetyllysine N-acetyltransferase n=1 Tax=Nocardioides marmoribigeumensis TaxID=433649 RepID=A0ABU2BVZ8_9ACTN|nr:NAD-dependent protein deacetylase [Nocardioides marmoribigeumensis]MDR7361903.1 NAD-dependent SIR2 family protein deacetylase [Nocardioides marmoribigeumensis]